ncbi:uncharacterized protein ANIA_11518 [Aspergillus nidulans FGSC A4]|uniref:Alpha/beta hydrolase fold-3 domain-containing protein n=1 Tax=Emericella nidulans (strain FGSC A4 / ATCC 38163 / CBS 112.46 / NRRL 194 / M139) TaxID=227321 RepID=C8V047_EMENI|nr:hypothetical protein [Aspergillus nidulans FGSC A4]CBF69377.1 TPA: hypothetical protein ANIA_11518 [Aspergillus nidulans FGSC A4]
MPAILHMSTGVLDYGTVRSRCGVDNTCIGVMGTSAGGGLAASAALMARDRWQKTPLAE